MVRLLASTFGLLAGTAVAQTPVADPVPAPVRTSNPATATAILTDPPPAGPPTIVVEEGTPVCQTRGSFDLLAGTFTGLRYQARLGPAGGPWLAELYGGFSAVVLPTVGVGLRRRAFSTGDSSDLLSVSPGIAAYALFAPWNWGEDRGTVGGAAVFDVDFTWKHAFSRHFEGALGLKVGAAVLFGRGGVLPYPLPVCSVFFGCGF